jgi:hypothetical protein
MSLITVGSIDTFLYIRKIVNPSWESVGLEQTALAIEK